MERQRCLTRRDAGVHDSCNPRRLGVEAATAWI
jgi:hypothetical protein